jgi:hypothetical protein
VGVADGGTGLPLAPRGPRNRGGQHHDPQDCGWQTGLPKRDPAPMRQCRLKAPASFPVTHYHGMPGLMSCPWVPGSVQKLARSASPTVAEVPAVSSARELPEASRKLYCWARRGKTEVLSLMGSPG